MHMLGRKSLAIFNAALLAFMSFTAIAQDKPSAGSATGGGPSDPQIAAIVVAANTVDVEAGKLAKSKAKDKDVKAFAQQMITDHTGVNKQATALVKKLGVKPEENDLSKSLKDDGKKNLAKLKTLKGTEFDKAYVDNEVTYHQQVLEVIDKTLLPSVKNAELKELVTKVRPAIAAHLDQAKQLQSKLGKS